MSDLPTTAATTSSASTVTVNGGFSRIALQSLTAGQVIYVRTDGAAAVVEADFNFAVPPYPQITIVPTLNGGTTTVFSAISSSAAKLYVREVDDSGDQ